MTDAQLLQRFIISRDQVAFGELVARHAGMVHAAALRQVGDAHLAEDITQAVFIVLASKPGSVHNGTRLAGWLVLTTRFVARDALKRKIRREHYEHQAAAMQQNNNQHDESAQALFQQIAPDLDEALARLGTLDRSALTLRYLEGRSMAEVAEALATTPAAAQKRVDRAMEKLRGLLAGRKTSAAGTMTAAALGAVLITASASAAPAGLAASTTAAALGGIGAAAGAAAGTGASALAQGVFIAMAAKAKLAIGAALAALLVVVATTGTVVVVASKGSGGHGPDQVATAPAESAGPVVATRAQPEPIRAGILVSYFHATGPSWIGRPYGLRDMSRLLTPLSDDAEILLVPLLEPGTEKKKEVGEVLDRYFTDADPVDATDDKELAKLDVIVLYQPWNMEQKVIDAVEKVVSNGVGYLQTSGPGLVTPGYNAQLGRLHAVKKPGYAWNPSANVRCTVLAEHPLLGSLKQGDTVTLAPNGLFGQDIELPLLRVEEDEKVRGAGYVYDPDLHFYPLYVGHCGKGKVVGCGWASYMAMPRELDRATGGRFYARAVRWLAGRKLE